MMQRRAFALLAFATLLLVVAFDAQGASDVAKVDKVGWWSKRPAAQATTGPTSFEVASGPDGNESVAAVRILIYGTVTKATLVVSEAANQTTAISVPKLQACRTDTPWILTKNPGPYTDAPKPDCTSGAVALARDDKGNWTGDITAMLTGPLSERSVMVLPAEDKSLPVPPTFFLQFATARVEADGTPDVAPASSPPTTVASAGAAPSRTVTPPPATAAPRPTSASTPTTAAVTPTTAAKTDAAAVPTRLGGTPVNAASKKKQWGKLVWIVPLSAIIAVGWVLTRKALTDRDLLAAN